MSTLPGGFLLMVFISASFSAIIISPPLQRRNIGGSCTFRWTITGSFSNYTITLPGSSSPAALPSNTNHSFDSGKGVITLYLWNIQPTNAGYYWLTAYNCSTPDENATAVLFVYATIYTNIILASGRNPAYEGDTIELNCSATSTSLPATFRPKIYYFWSIPYIGHLQNTSSGPAVNANGDVLSGFSLKNDGKTLVINSVQYPDSQGIRCQVQEEWSLLKYGFSSISLQVYGRPYIYSFSQPSRKFISVPNSVSFSCGSVPSLTSFTNLSFVDTSGKTWDLGEPQVTNYTTWFSFNIQLNTAVASNGNYSITLKNLNGSKTEVFQVIAPGPPDKPSGFRVQYVTHSLVSLQWRCMWSNGVEQTVFVLLKKISNNKDIEFITSKLGNVCYDVGYSTLFQTDIEPETDYEASIWSTNSYGSSAVQTLTVRSKKMPTFRVSCENISVTNSQAIINVTTSLFNVTWLNVTCCVYVTAICKAQLYTLLTPANQIVFENLPSGDKFLFDFILFNGNFYNYVYNLALVKGVRVSRTSGCDDANPASPATSVPVASPVDRSLIIAVIVLAVLLGIAVLVLIVCIVAYVVQKRRKETQSRNSQLPRMIEMPNTRPIQQASGNSETYDNWNGGYETLEEAEHQNNEYTTLEEAPPKPPKI